MIELELPFPPSVNHYWRRVLVKGRPRTLISARGRAYREAVAAAVLGQGKPRLGSARLQVAIAAFPPDQRARDLDNLLKATFDALTYAGVWGDDEQLDLIQIERQPAQPGGKLRVRIAAHQHTLQQGTRFETEEA